MLKTFVFQIFATSFWFLNEWQFNGSYVFPKHDIGAAAAKLNTYAQKYRQEILAGFELAIIRFIGGRLNH